MKEKKDVCERRMKSESGGRGVERERRGDVLGEEEGRKEKETDG